MRSNPDLKFSEQEFIFLKEKCGVTINDTNIHKYEGDECSICIDSYKSGEELVQFRQCPHAYHSNCLEGWFKINSTCPLCKMDKKDELKDNTIEDKEKEKENNDENSTEMSSNFDESLDSAQMTDNSQEKDLLDTEEASSSRHNFHPLEANSISTDSEENLKFNIKRP